MVYQQRGPPNDVITRVKARVLLESEVSEPMGYCVTCDTVRARMPASG
jgi:hypothetical protein